MRVCEFINTACAGAYNWVDQRVGFTDKLTRIFGVFANEAEYLENVAMKDKQIIKGEIRRGIAVSPILLIPSAFSQKVLISQGYITEALLQEAYTCTPVLKETLSQLSATQHMLGLSISLFGLVSMGVLEEYVFRHLFQKRFLKEYIGKIIEIKTPQLSNYWYGTTGKCIRICASTALFALAHAPQWLLSNESFNKEIAFIHTVRTVPLGLILSFIAENKNTYSSAGLHAGANSMHFIASVHKTIRACNLFGVK